MALKQILDTPAAFAANVGQSGMDLSAVPIKLVTVFTQVQIDDFEDAVLDPKWLRNGQPSNFISYLTNIDQGSGSFNTSSFRKAQTFQTVSNTSIRRASMILSASNPGAPPGNLICEIQTTTGAPGSEIPSGTILASSNPVPASSVPNIGLPPFTFFTHFEFPTPPALTAGTKYAIVLRQTAIGVDGISIYGEKSSSANYADGRALFYTESTSTWNVALSFFPFIYDWYFRLWEPDAATFPIETGGALRFDYTSATVPIRLETQYNDSPRDSYELETRFIWNRLAASGAAGLKFSVALLQGTIAPLPLSEADKDAKLLLEIQLRGNPTSDDFSILPIIVDASGNKRAYPPSPANWNGTPADPGHFLTPFGAASGVPITVKVSRQADGGVIVKAWKNDDESGQTIFLTTASPPVRTNLTGLVHLNIGNSPDVFSSRYDFSYFKLSGPTVEPPSGFVTFRRQFGSPTKVQSFNFTRTLPVVGDVINVRTRTGDTLAALLAATFSAPHPTTTVGSVESATPYLSPTKYIEYQLEFVHASPGPLLTGFDITMADAAVVEDSPTIFSLDANGPGTSSITTTEGETNTANTNKLKDNDPATQYASTNATDGTEVGITVSITPSIQPVNCVLLRNTNLKGVRVECPPGSTVFEGDLTADDELVTFPLVSSPGGVKVVGKSTKTPNQTKRIGEIYIGVVQLALPGFDEYAPNRLIRQGGSYEALGGKLITFNGVKKYGSTWTISRIPEGTLADLLTIFEGQRQVTFWPEPGAKPRELFDVAWAVEEMPHPYSELVKTDGHTVEGAMTELEGRV